MFGKHFALNDATIPVVEEIGRHMPGGFLIYRAQAPEELIYVNPTIIHLFGCADLEEFKAFTGFTFRGLVHPDDYGAVEQAINTQINRSDEDRIEYRIIRKDGAVRWVDDYGHYTETEAYGGIFYVFISDITEQREQMEEDSAVQKAVMNSLTNIYNTVWLINDIQTESCSLYHGDTSADSIHAEAIRNALSNARYT
ncbi:MAG: PAS domain-containing protein, partial [Clostridia bacterium]|nr:PAS domain-containing protein [Clostridia bacterium]